MLLVGGPSGCGKSSFAYPFAERFGLALTEADDLFIAAKTLTSPAELPDLHYFSTEPEATERLSPEEILEALLRTSRVLTPAFEAVVANHLETDRPMLLEGDYLLPELAERCDEQRVRMVFLIEEDEEQILLNYERREPEAGRQSKRARVSWLYGQWLLGECERCGLPVVNARPWSSLVDRVLVASS